MSSYLRRLRERVGPELLLLPSVAAAVHDDRGRLLLQRRADDGRWSLPAGMIEPGESPEQAIRREVREETGLEVTAARLRAVFGGAAWRHTYPNGDRVEYTVILFVCEARAIPGAQPDDETVALGWFAEAEMPPLALPYPREALSAPLTG